MWFKHAYKLLPFEKTTIKFSTNGKYSIIKKIVFTPPKLDKDFTHSLYCKSKNFEQKIKCGEKLSSNEDYNFGRELAANFLLCYLNGIKEAKEDLVNSINYLDGAAAERQAECMRILLAIENANK